MKYELVEVKFIDMYHFQMYEGKFKDLEQSNNGHSDKYIYANVSNFETETYEESEIRIYAYSYEDLYCAEDYELVNLYQSSICEDLKEQILKNINQRLITLTDGTGMGDTIIVFSTNAPTEELKALERISNDIYNNSEDIGDVPIWADVLTAKGYVFEFIDECQHVTPFGNSSDWLEEKYSNIKEHYIIKN